MRADPLPHPRRSSRRSPRSRRAVPLGAGRVTALAVGAVDAQARIEIDTSLSTHVVGDDR